MQGQFLQDRIDATKAMIILYEEAIFQLNDGSVQSYTLNTGQTTQTVTRFDVARLQVSLDGLYNRLATLEARQTGSGVVKVNPAW